jgi:hypothetical protein
LALYLLRFLAAAVVVEIRQYTDLLEEEEEALTLQMQRQEF